MGVSRPAHWAAVLPATFFINMMAEYYGLLYGILKPHIELEYNTFWPESEFAQTAVSVMGALSTALCLTLAPMGAAAVGLMGARKLTMVGSIFPVIFLCMSWLVNDVFQVFTSQARIFLDVLSLGFAVGVACGALYGPSIACAQIYFEQHKRGCVTGLVVCGGPSAALLLGPLSYELSLVLSWRGVLLIASAFALNGVPAAFAFDDSSPTSNEKEIELEGDSSSGLIKTICRFFRFELFSKWHFCCILLSSALSNVSYIPVMLLMSQASLPSSGVSEQFRATLLVFFGVANLVGRVLCGSLSDAGRHFRLLTPFSIYIISVVSCATALIVFAEFGVYMADVGFAIFAFVYGFAVSPLTTLRSLIMESMYGVERLTASFGWLLWAQGILFLVAFPLTDWLDNINITCSSIFVATCLLISGAIMALVYKPYFKRYHERLYEASMNKARQVQCITQNC